VKALLTISSIALRSSVLEDARADAGDKKDPELLQVGVAVEGPGQHLLRGDEDASMVSGSRETAGKSWISIGRMGGLRGY
jgi:hypothetical protein